MPTLSVCIPSRRRDAPDLLRLLASLQRQTFQDFEVIVETRGNSEEAKALAIQQAQGELIGFFCADNDLRDARFLEVMVQAASAEGVDGAYTAQYDYVQTDPALNRYFALLGANDPLCWWLGKSDRESYFQNGRGSRTVVFKSVIPSLGDNGFFCHAHTIKPFVTNPAMFGSCMDLWEDIKQAKGSLTFHVVSEVKLWHRTGDSLIDYCRRRYHYVKTLYFEKSTMRRWRMVCTPRDYLLVVGFVLSSLVFVPHLWVSLCGYRRVRDWSWFLHPLICFSITCVYTWAVMTSVLSFQPSTVRRS